MVAVHHCIKILFLILLLHSLATAATLVASLQKNNSSINLTFTFNQTNSISLKLLRNHDNQTEVNIFSKNKKWSGGEGYQTATYTSIEHTAIFSVETTTNPTKPATLYYGSFQHGDSIFNLEPSSALDAQPNSVHKIVYDLKIQGQAYKLYQERQMSGGGQDEVQSASTVEPAAMETWFNAKLQESISNPGGKVIVEFFIFLDFSVYDKWTKMTGDRTKALHNIKYYYTHIANGVRANYDLIKDPGYQVTMHFAGLYIAEREADDPVSLSTIRSGQYIDPNSALKLWVEFVEKRKMTQVFPSFDVAVAMTDYIMNGINGLAYLAKACQKRAVSLNKDNGPYQSINTLTHEIAHNLGSEHDGKNNYCNYNDQFVMASSRTQMTRENFKNQFVFSHCSVKQFKDYLDLLKKSSINCLRNVPSSMPASNTQEFLSQHPGQMFNIDQQCAIVQGHGSQACGGLKNDDKFCIRMSCFSKRLGLCLNGLNVAPAEGTTCGDRKWCVRGECVSDPKARSFRDSCLAGDSKELVRTQDASLTCKQLVARTPGHCYEKYYYDLCCASCLKLGEGKDKSCQYGDRYADCKLSECSYMAKDCCGTCDSNNPKVDKTPRKKAGKTPKKTCSDRKNCKSYPVYRCYEAVVVRDCCETCKRFEKPGAAKNCVYGDLGLWCKDRVKNSPSDCIRSAGIKKRCCESCKGVKDKTKGCQDIDNCSDVAAKDCYDGDIEKNCCSTCKKHRKNRIGSCRYGNRYRYCKQGYCNDQSFSSQCCEICG